MATAKQLAALKKARAARKKNLAAKKPAAKKRTVKKTVKRRTVARKPAAKKPARKRASTGGVVYAQKGAGTKYYYTGKSGKEALNSDRATAKKVGYITAAAVAKKLIAKVPAGYGIHYTGKKR